MSKNAFVIAMILAGPLAAQVSSSVTFNRDVLPILEKNCQACHRPGQVAPMSFLTYQQARPWAKAMKTAVVARKMPPWFADPKDGHFLNDRSLKPGEIDVIAKWADTGALEGDRRKRLQPSSGPRGGRSSRISSSKDRHTTFPPNRRTM